LKKKEEANQKISVGLSFKKRSPKDVAWKTELFAYIIS